MERHPVQDNERQLKYITVKERNHTELSSEIWKEVREEEAFYNLVSEGIIQARSISDGKGLLSSSCHVGHAVLGQYCIKVEEKVPGALDALSSKIPENNKKTHFSSSAEVSEINTESYIREFLQLVKVYISQGREFFYSKSSRTGSLAGGKINTTKTIQLRARGMGHILAFEQQEISYSTEFNYLIYRTLLEAKKLCQSLNLPSEIIFLIRRQIMSFSDNHNETLLNRKISFYIDTASRLLLKRKSKTKHRILELSKLLLSGLSTSKTPTNNTIAQGAWFYNLETLFEEATRNCLFIEGNLKAIKGSDKEDFLLKNDQASLYRLNPDYVIIDSNSSVIAVGDAKYKNLKPTPSNSDVYQLLIHSQCFESKIAFLIYPGDNLSIKKLGKTKNGIITLMITVRVQNLLDDCQAALLAINRLKGGASPNTNQ